MKRFLLSQLYGGSRRSSRYGNANVYPGQATFPREQQLRHRHTSMSSTKVFSAVGFNDYDAGVRDFKIEVPEHFNFSTDVIDSWAKLDNGSDFENLAFWWTDQNGNEVKWTFKQLSDLSKRVANLMTSRCGIKPGDNVMVVLPRIPAWWLINIGICRTGGVLMPGTVQLTDRDLSYRLNTSQATTVIANYDIADKIDSIIHGCPSVRHKILVEDETMTKRSRPMKDWLNFNDLMNQANDTHKAFSTKSKDALQIFFTSGTTGSPKLTEHTQASYGIASLITGKYWLDLTARDIHWNLSDTGWAKSAWSSVFAPWSRGACVFVNNSRKFDAKETLKVLEKYPITTFCATPTAYRMMVREPLHRFHIGTVRHCVSAGEPLNPEVIDKWRDSTGIVVREGYGQTETVSVLLVLQCGSFRCIENKPGSMGKPAPGMDVRCDTRDINTQIIDDSGSEVPTNTEGDIAIKVKPVRPTGLFRRYVGEEEKTKAVFKGDYYLTGDRATRDSDGYLWFVARSDDVILSSGYRIGPFEVESALIEHEAVLESAVVSSPDETRGEVVKAFIILAKEHKHRNLDKLTYELQEMVKSITAPYKYPRIIEFVDTLPKTVSGKIRRIELKQKEWNKSK